MPRPTEFVAHVVELLAPLGGVRARAMFGGWGVYRDDLMFGLIAEDTLYFRTDAASRERYEARGAGPFQPFADKPTVLPYHEAPAELFDDPELLVDWARAALATAEHARAAKPKRRTKSKG